MSKTDSTYTCLHQAIVRGELLPQERLVELELAEKFGVGRAAVRAALVRLEQDGLVEREPNRGAKVRAISEAEAVELYEARAALEGLAARYAARMANAQQIAALQAIHTQMRTCFEQGDLLNISKLNCKLHEKIVKMANHQTVADLIHRLRAQHVRFQYRTILVPGRAKQSLAEHGAIIDAIAKGDGDAAERAMRTHLANVIDALHSSINQGSSYANH